MEHNPIGWDYAAMPSQSLIRGLVFVDVAVLETVHGTDALGVVCCLGLPIERNVEILFHFATLFFNVIQYVNYLSMN